MPSKTKTEPHLHIIADDREKAGFDFSRCKDVASVTTSRLHTADYTLKGLEHLVAVEKKSGAVELHGTLVTNRERFDRELERMKTIPSAHIIVCGDISELLAYPNGSSLSPYVKKKIRITGSQLLRRIWAIQARYPHVRWWFASTPTAGRDLTLAILKQAAREHPDLIPHP